jgi:hypothetical protein
MEKGEIGTCFIGRNRTYDFYGFILFPNGGKIKKNYFERMLSRLAFF